MFIKMKKLLNLSAESIFNAAEEKLKPELQGINALASSLALLVMADRVAEVEELEAMSEYIISLDVVINNNLTREVSEFFLASIENLEHGYKKGVVQGNIVVGEILHSVSRVKDNIEWSNVVADTVNLVTSGDEVDPMEIKTRERILKALGR